MNRVVLAAVATATVLGTAGGVGYALSSGSAEPASGDPAGDDLFYFLHGTIHDDATDLDVPGVEADQVVELRREGEGYLVVAYAADGVTLRGTYVATDGSTRDTGAVPAPPARVSSPDGAHAIAQEDGCLTGGPAGARERWWRECGTGPASSSPYAPDGGLLLTAEVVDDGPAAPGLLLRDPATGAVRGRLDPAGSQRLHAEWAGAEAVDVVTGTDTSTTVVLSRCELASQRCTPVLEAEGNLVPGVRS